MANPDFEEECKDLKVKNTELVQMVQFWKMKSAQFENDKLKLMKENNDLRLKISRLRSGGAAQARALDCALQSSSREALAHLVQASTAIAHSIDLAKSYMREHDDLADATPRWSMLSGTTPSKERVHKVAPMMMGGRSIQPYVTLDRINLSNPSLASGNSNQSRNSTERVLPLPMHVLHDVYIPLQRIDPSEFRNSIGETDQEESDADIMDGQENIVDNEMNEEVQENTTEMTEQEFNNSRQLNVVHEDSEPDDTATTPPPPRRLCVDNPMEGPSWLLDHLPRGKKRDRSNLEPDSTTEPEPASLESPASLDSLDSPVATDNSDEAKENIPLANMRTAFTPTTRRRPPRSGSPQPPLSPLPDATHQRRNSKKNRISDRVLKVLLPKMEWADACSPPKAMRLSSFEAPSPSGATDAGLCVLEQLEIRDPVSPPRAPSSDQSDMTNMSLTRDVSGGSDSGVEAAATGVRGRTRRPRKQVVYKEKPLNRKLRR